MLRKEIMSRRAPYELAITDKLRTILTSSYLTSDKINQIIERNTYKFRTVPELCAGLRKDLVEVLIKEGKCPAEVIERSIGCPEDLDAVKFWLEDIRQIMTIDGKTGRGLKKPVIEVFP